ncbi:MAG: response regulator [Planctomycetota bacterium]|nr:MAG: response regulator [Planctomycetota bacterium]
MSINSRLAEPEGRNLPGFAPLAMAALDRERRREVVFVASSLFLVVVTCIGFTMFWAGLPEIGAVVLFSQLLNALGWLDLRRGRRVDFYSWTLLFLFFGTVSFTTVHTQGIISVVAPWLFLVPLLGGFLFGTLGVVVMATADLLWFLALAFWNFSSGIPESRIEGTTIVALTLISHSFGLLTLVALAVAWTRSLQKAEQQRRQSEQGFREALGGFPDAVAVLLPGEEPGTSLVLYQNRLADQLNRSLQDQGIDLPAFLQQNLDGDAWQQILQLRSDHHRFHLRNLAAPANKIFDLVVIGWKRARIFHFHDSTSRALMEKDLAQATASKSRFLASMSHEIRTPMNGILGMAQLAHATEMNEEQREYIETIQSCADSLLDLLNDILDLSKIEAGKLELERIPFHLDGILDLLQDSLLAKAGQQNTSWNAFRRPEVPVHLIGDPTRLRQILINLSGNALKFTTEGSVQAEVHLLEEEAESCLLRFEVRDTGAGIPPESLPTLFDDFTQAQSSTSRQFGGTGLGLSISKQLVEMMGGRMKVRSRLGEGSTFWFEIRLPKAPVNEPPPGKNKRVWILDPGSPHSSPLRYRLQALGCRNVLLSSMEEWHALQDQQEEAWEAEFLFVHRSLCHQQTRRLWQPWLQQKGNRRLFFMTEGNDSWREYQEHFPEAQGRLILPAKCKSLNRILLGQYGKQENELQEWARFQGYVLLAEDNPVNQRLAVRMLEKLGLELFVVPDGGQALQAVQNQSFDLVLMDCQMPNMDGYEATRRIRELDEPVGKIPILALTANAMTEDKQRCLEAGMDDFLSKPLDWQKLQSLLGRYLPTSAAHS